MKKFFKALALVLALVLVIGTIPASAAASSFKLTGDKDGKKIIYLGGSNGEDKEGKKCSAKNYFDFTTHIEGFDAETMDIKLKAKDDTIVSTWNKSDRVYAKKIGKTVVTVYIYDSETGKLLDSSLKVPIQVKKNAESIEYIVKNAEGDVVEDLTEKKLGVNTEYTFTLTRRDAEGNVTDTDNRVIRCESKDVTIESINAPYNTAYKVVFTKAGEYSLQFAAFQSSKYDKDLLTKDIKVVAGYDAVDAKQSGLKSADVTFETNVNGLEAKNFNAYYEVNGVKVYPTSAQSVSCKENVATVTFLSDFIQGETYFIEYDGAVAGSFKAANFTADSVVAIEIPAQEVEVGVNTKLNYKLLDENGLDIKDLLGSTLTGVLSFELENADIDTYVTSGNAPEVYIGTVNKSYTVKAVYSWINNNGDEKKAEGKGVVASIPVVAWTQGQVTGMLSNEAKDYVNADKNGFTDIKAAAQWSISDGNMNLQIAVPFTKSGTTKYETFSTAGSVAGFYTSYTVKAADESYVMIGAISGDKITLIPNKVGSTSILIYGVKDNVSKVVGAIPVTVVDGRKATTFKVTASKNSINAAYGADEITFKLEVKDQFGADKAETIKVESINKVAGKTPAVTFDGKGDIAVGDFKVAGSDFEKLAGTVNLKFSVNGTGLSQTVFVKVGNDASAKMQTLKLSASKLDTGVKNDTKITDLVISLEGRTQEGYAITGASISFSGTALKTRALSGNSIAFNYFYTVSKDGAVKSAGDLGLPFTEGANKFQAVAKKDTAASAEAIKLGAGTYTVTAYSQTVNGDTIVVSQIGTQQFTVEDKQDGAVVTRRNTAEQLGTIDNGTIGEFGYKVEFNGADVTKDSTFDFTLSGDKTSAYVKSVSFKVGNETVGYFTVKKDIGEVVRTK